MNRNLLKIIALISMLIDHLGAYFFQNLIIFRIIGRIAFPIFAFFIAEGWRYTKSKKRYFTTLFIFALISQIPYTLLHMNLDLNILFTFILALASIWCIEKIQNKNHAFFFILFPIIILVFVLSYLNILDYGMLGVLLVLSFYFVKHKIWKLIIASVILIMITLKNALLSSFAFSNLTQAFSLLSIILLAIYNNQKGKFNLKYLFYIFYPTHLFIIYLIGLL